MILSRIVQNLKQQHWTAISIEFAIVVIGVFIGTNVTNWNDARNQQQRAAVYTRRLMEDLRVEHENALSLRAYIREALAAGQTAFDGLTRARPLDDRAVLVAAYRGVQYQWYERHRATYDELLSSGTLEQVADPHLRETAVRFYGNSGTVFDGMQDDARNSQYRRLFFSLVDPQVILALRRDCGDRPTTTPGGIPGVFTIDYACELRLDDATVSRTVAALRAAAELLPALRRQCATYDVEIANLDYTLSDTGIETLFAKADAPEATKP